MKEEVGNRLNELKLDLFLAMETDCQEWQKTQLLLNWSLSSSTLLEDINNLGEYDLIALYNQVYNFLTEGGKKPETLESLTGYYIPTMVEEIRNSGRLININEPDWRILEEYKAFTKRLKQIKQYKNEL